MGTGGEVVGWVWTAGMTKWVCSQTPGSCLAPGDHTCFAPSLVLTRISCEVSYCPLWTNLESSMLSYWAQP